MKILITGCRRPAGYRAAKAALLPERLRPRARCRQRLQQAPPCIPVDVDDTGHHRPSRSDHQLYPPPRSLRLSSTARLSPMWTAAKSNREAAFAVNASGCAQPGHGLRRRSAQSLVHVSTDYVFRGDAGGGTALDECDRARACARPTARPSCWASSMYERFCTPLFHRAHRLAVRLLRATTLSRPWSAWARQHGERDGGERPAGQPHQRGGSGPPHPQAGR